MLSNIEYALWITLIGMGAVFVALLLLWALMEILMKLTAWYNRRSPEAEEAEEEEEDEPEVVVEPAIPSILKRKAAVAAVAAALAIKRASAAVSAQPGGASSAWRASMRAAELNQRSIHFTRKNRGNVR
jgi:Na+-transporting methylmalonyl-CoA/oxaloacetate decarboxylase gamma subunit